MYPRHPKLDRICFALLCVMMATFYVWAIWTGEFR